MMKIYRFNPETGIYLGEDFADEAPMCQRREAVPPDAAAIAPPPYRRGEVPVYSVAKNQWEIRPVFAAIAESGGDRRVQTNLPSNRQTSRHMR